MIVGHYFRLQKKKHDGEWAFVTGLDSFDSTKYMALAHRSVYTHDKYRIVEHITDEIYDVVPEGTSA